MSFIDLDSMVGTKAINAAFDVKNERNDIQLLFAKPLRESWTPKNR